MKISRLQNAALKLSEPAPISEKISAVIHAVPEFHENMRIGKVRSRLAKIGRDYVDKHDSIKDVVWDADSERFRPKVKFERPSAALRTGLLDKPVVRKLFQDVPPNSPLVGVELNPGPPKKAVPQKRKKNKAKAPRNGSTVMKVKRSLAPSTTGFTISGNKPFMSSKDGATRVVHTEYVRDLISSTTANTYLANGYSLNPANPAVFPWLSTMASLYGQCVPNSISFHIESLVSTATNGMCALAVTPDCTDPTPTTKTDLMEINSRQRGNIWMHTDYAVPTAILKRIPKFVTSALDPATDLDKSIGKFIVASDACPAGTRYGELYVSYDITFYDEQPATYATFKSFSSINDIDWYSTPVIETTMSHIPSATIATTGISTNNGWVVFNKGGPAAYVHLSASANSGTLGGSTTFLSLQMVDSFGVDITAANITFVAGNTGAPGSAINIYGTILLKKFTSPCAIRPIFVTVAAPTVPLAIGAAGIVSVSEKRANVYPNSVESSFTGLQSIESLSHELALLRSSVANLRETHSPIHSEDEEMLVPSHLSNSYVTRLGDALGVPRSGILKK